MLQKYPSAITALDPALHQQLQQQEQQPASTGVCLFVVVQAVSASEQLHQLHTSQCHVSLWCQKLYLHKNLHAVRLQTLVCILCAVFPPGVTALVFGREESGLTEEELRLCSQSCSIPTGRMQGSMNLSHAVAVVLSGLFERRLGVLGFTENPGLELKGARQKGGVCKCKGNALLVGFLCFAGCSPGCLLARHEAAGCRSIQHNPNTHSHTHTHT